jgi:hypothetical protein
MNVTSAVCPIADELTDNQEKRILLIFSPKPEADEVSAVLAGPVTRRDMYGRRLQVRDLLVGSC